MTKVSQGDRDAYTKLYNKYFSAVVNFIASSNPTFSLNGVKGGLW